MFNIVYDEKLKVYNVYINGEYVGCYLTRENAERMRKEIK